MKKFLFLFLVVLSFDVNSQNFAPIGTQWHYTYANFSVFGYVEITSVDDTIINGYECKKLSKFRETYDYLSNQYNDEDLGAEFVRSDEDKVYIYRNGLFYTLYDFSAQIDETWDIPYTYDVPEECDTIGTVKVINTGDTIIQGESLRYVVVESLENSAWQLYGMIIEKIGPVELYLLPEQTCLLDFYEGGVFRCFDNGEFHVETGPYPCRYITLGISELDDKSLNCYPNPATQIITFELPEVIKSTSLLIKDITGSTIETITINSKQDKLVWNCSKVSKGVYFYQTQINEEVYRGKIVVN